MKNMTISISIKKILVGVAAVSALVLPMFAMATFEEKEALLKQIHQMVVDATPEVPPTNAAINELNNASNLLAGAKINVAKGDFAGAIKKLQQIFNMEFNASRREANAVAFYDLLKTFWALIKANIDDLKQQQAQQSQKSVVPENQAAIKELQEQIRALAGHEYAPAKNLNAPAVLTPNGCSAMKSAPDTRKVGTAATKARKAVGEFVTALRSAGVIVPKWLEHVLENLGKFAVYQKGSACNAAAEQMVKSGTDPFGDGDDFWYESPLTPPPPRTPAINGGKSVVPAGGKSLQPARPTPPQAPSTDRSAAPSVADIVIPGSGEPRGSASHVCGGPGSEYIGACRGNTLFCTTENQNLGDRQFPCGGNVCRVNLNNQTMASCDPV